MALKTSALTRSGLAQLLYEIRARTVGKVQVDYRHVHRELCALENFSGLREGSRPCHHGEVRLPFQHER
jgi:hypothetical protein